MLKKGLLLVAASAVSVSAFAGGLDRAPAASVKSTPYYAGAQLGYVAQYGFNNTVAATSSEAPTYAKHQGALGARVFAGYNFDNTYAVELGMGSFGSKKVASNSTDGATTAKGQPYSTKDRVRFSVDASVVGRMDLDKDFTGFAKVGGALTQYKSSSLLVSSVSVKTWKLIPRAEIGVGYHVAKNIDATVSYAHYFGVGTARKVENMGVLAAGMTYSF